MGNNQSGALHGPPQSLVISTELVGSSLLSFSLHFVNGRGIEHTRKDAVSLMKFYSYCHLPSQSSFLLTLQIFVNRQSIRAIDVYFGEHIKLDAIAISKLFNHRLRIGFL